MKKIILFYGERILMGLLYFGIFTGIFFLVYRGLRTYGVVENTSMEKMNVTMDILEAPTLYTRNRSFSQGEIVKVSELATARDGDSTDISAHIRFYTKEGKRVQGFFDTQTPGSYEIRVSVCSPVTEKETKQNILVLIDGRV